MTVSNTLIMASYKAFVSSADMPILIHSSSSLTGNKTPVNFSANPFMCWNFDVNSAVIPSEVLHNYVARLALSLVHRSAQCPPIQATRRRGLELIQSRGYETLAAERW